MVKPGPDTVITFGSIALSGALWWLCRRGKRSIRFCRIVDGVGPLLVAIVGTFLTRYILVGFVREHSVVTAEGSVMADGYVVMIDLFPAAMFLAIRAALIPSSPRRTIIITAMVGVPKILLSSALVPAIGGGLAWRAAHSGAFPWLPTTSIMEWTIATITCTVISRVIYGLRAEVREARRFGQYVLERKIGEGAMGVVYRATHAMLRRPAAIKLLLKDRASEADLARFEREVQLTSRLVHPNTISIFDYGRTAEGVFYYVMEYLDGLDLQRLVDQYGPVEPARAIHILAQISGALAEAHALGLIHRDIKPANIVLTERPDEPDVVKVVDFGLVKRFGGNLAESAATDAIIGTPLYMAPEAISQARHRRRTLRSLRRGRGRLLPAHGTARVRGRLHPRGLQQAHAGGADAPLAEAGEGPSHGSRSHRARVPREGSRRPSRVGRASASRPLGLRRRRTLRPAGGSGLVASPSCLPEEQPEPGRPDRRRLASSDDGDRSGRPEHRGSEHRQLTDRRLADRCPRRRRTPVASAAPDVRSSVSTDRNQTAFVMARRLLRQAARSA